MAETKDTTIGYEIWHADWTRVWRVVGDEYVRRVYRERLSALLAQHGPIECVRVSSAQARGAAGRYPYWGAVDYQIRLGSRGRGPVLVARGRARSDRRSIRLAERDAERRAEARGALYLGQCDLGLDAALLRDAIEHCEAVAQ
jgi:hypothetical protein